MTLASHVPPDHRRGILRTALSVGAATGAYGLSFGALAVTQGHLNPWQAQLLSLLLFSGASQFAIVGIVGAGGSAAAAMTSTLLLGLRNGLYGLRLSAVVHPRGWRKAFNAHVTIDESTAVTLANSNEVAPDRERSAYAFWSTGLSVFILWNIATAIGALAARHIGDPRQFGLDAAIPCGFAALILPRLRSFNDWLLSGLAAVIAVGVSPWVRPGVPVLIVAAATLIIAVFNTRRQPPSPLGDGKPS